MPRSTHRQNRRSSERADAAIRKDRAAAVKAFNRNAQIFPGGPRQARLLIIRQAALTEAILAMFAPSPDVRRAAERSDIVRQIPAIIRFNGIWATMRPGNSHTPLCVACDTDFNARSPVHAYAILEPIKAGDALIVTGICRRCAMKSDEELMLVYGKDLQKYWPGTECRMEVL